MLYAIDSASDTLSVQNPPTSDADDRSAPAVRRRTTRPGFDIAGADNVGYLATRMNRGSGLYAVDPATGRSRFAGRIGGGSRLVVTGLAAWQD